DQNDEQDHLFKVQSDPGNRAKIIAGGGHGADPKDPAENIISRESGVRHLAYSCHHGCKSSGEGNKTRQEYGFATMFLIKFLGLQKVFTPEPEAIFSFI